MNRPKHSLSAALLALLLLMTAACSDSNGGDNGTGPDDNNLPGITGYPIVSTNQTTFYVNTGPITCPSPGDPFSGQNAQYTSNPPEYVDNGDGTVTDYATGLMWSQIDSGDDSFAARLAEYINSDGSLNWEEALDFAETVEYAGYNDWRLPDAKELHSLLDFDRSPDVTGTAAIDPIFATTEIVNEGGETDHPSYWTSTTFEPGSDAVVIFFGRAMGYIGGGFIDVHGAGAQRTDPKEGDPSYGFGPQGDVRRVYNYVRLVRTLLACWWVARGLPRVY